VISAIITDSLWIGIRKSNRVNQRKSALIDHQLSISEILLMSADDWQINDFHFGVLGKTGINVCRLVWLLPIAPADKQYTARSTRVSISFLLRFRLHAIRVLRELTPGSREKVVIATGAYNLILGYPNLRRTLEKRLRQLRTDYIDVFLFWSDEAEAVFCGSNRTAESFP